MYDFDGRPDGRNGGGQAQASLVILPVGDPRISEIVSWAYTHRPIYAPYHFPGMMALIQQTLLMGGIAFGVGYNGSEALAVVSLRGADEAFLVFVASRQAGGLRRLLQEGRPFLRAMGVRRITGVVYGPLRRAEKMARILGASTFLGLEAPVGDT